MATRLTVLGCGDAFSHGGRMTSAYLVEEPCAGGGEGGGEGEDEGEGRRGSGGARVMLDFGLTAMTALQRAAIAPDSIGRVVISHLHGDHFGGLPLLLLWREIHGAPDRPLAVIGPPGMTARLRALHEAMYPGSWRRAWRFPLELVELEPGRPLQHGGWGLTSQRVRHEAGPEPATGLRLVTPAGRVVAFSGDGGWSEALVDLARDSDLFLCECALSGGAGEGGHMSLERLRAERDRLATRRLVLVHLGPEMLAQPLPAGFEAARDGQVFDL